MSKNYDKTSIAKQVKLLRWARKVHKYSGISLFVFFIIIGFTGLLLTWKKNSSELIMPETRSIEMASLSKASSLFDLESKVKNYIDVHSLNTEYSELDKIDIRPTKGIGKFIYKNGDEYQISLESGQILNYGKRYSDLFEKLHDGSYISDPFKLFYGTIMSLSLVIFSLTGFWLYLGPKNIKKRKRK
ncbi:MAG: PepSY domain-containing protein [Flavobacteriaceae bacterium]